MWQFVTRLIISITFTAMIMGTATAAPPDHAQNKDKSIDRLKSENRGAEVTKNSATGTADFVKLPPGLAAKGTDLNSQNKKTQEFLNQYAEAFGLDASGSGLRLVASDKDSLGQTHLKYKQFYAGVPVFGAVLKAHFDENNDLSVISGTLVPDIEVWSVPSRSPGEAGDTALQWIKSESGHSGLMVLGSQLLVFREGLARGTPGANHLAYEVEVGNGVDVREFVYIDAHTGKYIDQITGIADAMYRRAYNGNGGSLAFVLTIWPGSPFWVEGNAFPTGSAEANNMLLASKETYDLFSHAFGRDSFDGAGATMDSIFNRGYSCPNASWNGAFISFCPGLTTDDVTGHEWGHAYTEYTDNLIYQWQPGALNESYSDVVGETVDQINGRGGDTPDALRTAGSCSVFTAQPPKVTINSPAAIAGNKSAGTAAFGPQSFAPVTADVVGVNDGVGATIDGCETPFANAAAVAGKIAFMDRGTCAFTVKVKNAQLNGAIAAIIGNNAAGIINMSGADPTITIPSLSVLQSDGTDIKTQLAVPTTVNATLSREVGTDNSVLWLLGEDSTATGLVGALRDLWTPSCYGDPGKVSDTFYHCATSDNGGVHRNSGVPNHAFALLVDGGTYNGHTVSGIGLTKANHIYYRAKTHYQGPATDFAAHADALEQACDDLLGQELSSLIDGSPSGEVISAADCDAVADAMAAVEMRLAPSQCGFQPLLAKNPPPLCASPTKSARVLFTDGFENGGSSLDKWTRSHFAVAPADFTERDWSLVSNLPDNRAGRGFFAPDPDYGTCATGGDESSVLHLDSPQITIPASATNLRMVFDHWFASEFGYDGGNVKISVNGGPWQIVNYTDFVYNSYNIFLVSAPGNTNPLAGEQAFSGADGGSVDGSWGRSIINLAPYAQPKDKIRLRFDMGVDGCGGTFGWYLDDVSVYECR